MAHTFQRLLLATEHGEQDGGAETLAFALARRRSMPLAAVMPLASNAEFEAAAPEQAASAESKAGARLRALQAAAQAAGVVLQATVRRGPEAHAEIVAEATAQRADLIVIRRRGPRGLLAKVLVGDMVRSVVSHAPCSVIVAARAAQWWQRRVMVAVDPMAADLTPVEQAVAVAAECGLPLSALCVTAAAADAMHKAERALQAAWSLGRARGVAVDALVQIGRPHEQIVGTAKELGADLIVIGRHGDDQLPHARLGGVAQKVIGLADRKVLVAVAPRVPS